jgi:hypothetical protein
MLTVREWRTQLFVYLVAFLPLALLTALVTGALLTSGGESTVTSITVNLAVATLAILPLRAVLVPPDLQGLTRIDYILVIQLLLIISVAFLLNGWQLSVSSPEKNSGEEIISRLTTECRAISSGRPFNAYYVRILGEQGAEPWLRVCVVSER